jgi:hypothetical protein
MTPKEINNSMMMNGGNTPEQKADFAWYNYCFEFKDGPYTAIVEYKKALRREIEKLIVKSYDGEDTAFNNGLGKCLSLIDTVSPE